MTLTILFVIAMVLPWSCGSEVTREKLQASAASSLSEQFETVLFSKPEFVSSWETNNPLPRVPARNLRYPFAYLWLALDSLSPNAAPELLANSTFVLMGAKDFRAPFGLGGVRSQRCYVLVLKSGSSFDFQKYIHSPVVPSMTGLQVWSWSSKLEEFGEGGPNDVGERNQPSTLYATKIEQSFFLVSNDMNELELLAKRLASSNRTQQNRGGFNDSNELLQHEMGGYRRYRHSETTDPMAAGTQDFPPAAETLEYFVDAKKKTVVLRLVLKNSMDESAVAKLYAKQKLPPPTHSATGTWDTTIPLTDDRATFERTFFLMGLFGFAVFT